MPLLIAQQIILETTETDTIMTEDIACFQAIAQQTVDQKLIAIRQKTSLPVHVLRIEVAFGRLGYEVQRDCLWRILPERSSFAKGQFARSAGSG